MKFIINGEEKDVEADTIAALVVALGVPETQFAIEVNGEIVPKQKHASYRLNEDDKIEIVRFIGGG